MKKGLFNDFFGGSSSIGPPIITDIAGTDTIQSIRVPAGTAFASINFSDYYRDYVPVIQYNGTIVNVPIVWSSAGYSTSAGTYVLNGNFSLPGGVTNTQNIVPQISVQVVALDSDVQAVLTQAGIDGVTIPTPICIGEINALITGEKTDGTYVTKGCYYITENDGSSGFSLYNYKNTATFKLIINGTVTWTSRKGFTGNGTTGFLNTQYNTSTAADFTQNDCGYGVYVYSEGNTGQILGNVATGARVSLNNSARSTTFEVTGNTNPNYVDDWGVGYYHTYRSASGNINGAKNSVLYSSAVTDASVARPNANIYILARNNAGTADSFSNATVSHFWAGASLGSGAASMYGRWATYHQAIRVKNSYTSPGTIGVKLNDAFNRASLGTAYVVQGGTWACDGTKLNYSGGAGDFIKRCVWKYGQSSENVQIENTFTLTQTPDANSSGVGPCFSDYSGVNGERSILSQMNFSSGVSGGKCFLWTWNGTTSVQVAQSSGTISSLTNGDVFNTTLNKVTNSTNITYTFTCTRVSDSASVNCSYSTLIGDSTGDIGINTYGGTGSCTLMKVTFNDLTKSKITIVGNSLSHGVASTTMANRFAANINSSYQITAGSGDTTRELVGSTSTIVGKMRNVLDYFSPYYLSIIGGNDVAAGFTTELQNSLKKEVYQIENEGHIVILVTPPARNDADMTTITGYYNSLFPGRIIITAGYTAVKDAGTGLNATYNSGDNVHMNNAGHAAYAAAVSANMPILYRAA